MFYREWEIEIKRVEEYYNREPKVRISTYGGLRGDTAGDILKESRTLEPSCQVEVK